MGKKILYKVDLTSPMLDANPHCMQARDSEVRQCLSDLQFDMELHIDGQDVPEEPYVEMKHLDATVHHWGQLKLLLGEVDFLTPYLDVPKLCVVYAGASPGHHLDALVRAMPSTWTWELYDDKPNEVFSPNSRENVIEKQVTDRHVRCVATHGGLFNHQQELSLKRLECKRHLELEPQNSKLKSQLWKLDHTALIFREHKRNVKTHQEILTLDEARYLREQYVSGPQTQADPQLLFISDIRTPRDRITEDVVELDMRVQKAIARALRPYQSSLKFRLPYSDEYCVQRPYLDGKLLYQPFSPKVSHECRLHVGHECNKRHYDRMEFNSKMFRFQTVVRTSTYDLEGELPSADRHPHLVSKRVGTDHCFDCTAARTIARHYARHYGLHELDVLNRWVGGVITTQRACWADGSIQDD